MLEMFAPHEVCTVFTGVQSDIVVPEMVHITDVAVCDVVELPSINVNTTLFVSINATHPLPLADAHKFIGVQYVTESALDTVATTAVAFHPTMYISTYTHDDMAHCQTYVFAHHNAVLVDTSVFI